MLDIIIEGIKYTYVKSMKINDKNYIAYSDDNNIYISEYEVVDNSISIKEISDLDFLRIKEEMGL